MESEARIDWLTFYTSDIDIVPMIEEIGQTDVNHHWESSPSGEARCRVVLSGQKLEELRKNGTLDYILTLVDGVETITRCDIAFDFRKKIDLPGYYEQNKDNAKLAIIISQTGQTVYSGSRQSKLFVRLYDKKAECARRGDDIPETTRVEIEAKRELARQAFMLFQTGRLGDLLGWTVKKLPGCPLLVDVDPVKPKMNKRDPLRADRIWWVVERYKKSIRKAMEEDKKRFMEIVNGA